MTREREDELLAELRELRQETNRLIQLIVDARMKGERNDEAIQRLGELSRRHEKLTRPTFEAA